MSNHLGEYIQARRLELGLGRGEVARLLGYENLNRGSRRLCDVEVGRWYGLDFLRRLTTLLQIEPKVVQDLIDRDREEYVAEWEKWADEPIPMQVVVRCIPGVFGNVKLPDNVTTPEQAITFGSETAKRLRKIVIVVISRRVSYTIHEDGVIPSPNIATPDRDVIPSMRLGNKRFLLSFDGIGEAEDSPR